MNTYTVCFFGHREIYNLFELEEKLEEHKRKKENDRHAGKNL